MIVIMTYLYTLLCIYRTPKKVFVGATEDWSPTAEYALVPSLIYTEEELVHREFDEIVSHLSKELDWWQNYTSEYLLVEA
jgi:ATP/ADP translocase